MTNQELLEGMQSDLSLITGATDADKLVALVLEKAPRLLENLSKLAEQVRVIQPEQLASIDQAQSGLLCILTGAQLMQDGSAPVSVCIRTMSESVPRVDVALNKIARAMRSK